ncbi:MAG: NAD-dependent dihydropyrimidine dehydrogenase subunit PreA, partial [Actinobacteria bacterium]|nr:NAD-dependent dihydropyrimidine dehydrogenase subunit PreA [Actinomycetota bacterium]
FLKERARIVGMTNFELISEKGLDHWVEEIGDVKRAFPDRPLIASIMGSLEPADWEILTKAVEAAGADAVELNVSCPHGMPEQHMGAFMGQDPELIKLATAAVAGVATTPVWVKLTPNVTDIAAMAVAAKDAGADVIAAINTVAGLVGIDLETFEPLPSVAEKGAYGGYSGRGVKPIALRAVSSIAATSGLPVSGCGGITIWEDAAEFMLAGAGTLQVCTAVMLNGFGVIDELAAGLSQYLERKGFESYGDAVGRSLASIGDYSSLDNTVPAHAQVDPEACNGCRNCIPACADGGFQAISMNGKTAVIDPAICDGCGLCPSVCRPNAITMVRA